MTDLGGLIKAGTQARKTGKDTSPASDLIDFYATTGQCIIRSGAGITTLRDLTGDLETDIKNFKGGGFVGTGSSEMEDRAGDRMERSALLDMTTLVGKEDLQGVSRKPICFMNHDYGLPWGVQGSIERVDVKFAEIRDPESGLNKPLAYIEIEAGVTPRNPLAIQNYFYMLDGLRIGISVGVQVLDFDFIVDQDGWIIGLIIKRVDPLEFSTVGVPCETNSYVSEAVKGLFRKHAGVSIAKTAPQEIARMAAAWRDFEGLDALMLRRVSKAVSLVRQTQILKDFTHLALDHEDKRLLGAIAASLEPFGLGITTLAEVASVKES